MKISNTSRSIPQRVDYVIFGAGKRVVVEIDGPNHYAQYDEGRREYVVSEALYTKNLKIERRLRRQGWRILRFSRLEADTVPVEEFGNLTAELPDVRRFEW